jgi:hypothetical protein
VILDRTQVSQCTAAGAVLWMLFVRGIRNTAIAFNEGIGNALLLVAVFSATSSTVSLLRWAAALRVDQLLAGVFVGLVRALLLDGIVFMWMYGL